MVCGDNANKLFNTKPPIGCAGAAGVVLAAEVAVPTGCGGCGADSDDEAQELATEHDHLCTLFTEASPDWCLWKMFRRGR